MNLPKGFDPIADFSRRWPKDKNQITPVMDAFRRVAEAQAYKLKALLDLDEAMRMLFMAEAELEFVKTATSRKGN